MVKNPLRKRLTRELKSDFGKYFFIFLFLVIVIGFVSGFLVATDSMQTAFDESFTKYNIEDGHVTFSEQASDTFITNVEKSQNVKFYELFYKGVQRDNDDTFRVYKNRADVDKICLLEGKLADAADEVAIDRMYAENASLSVGDTVKLLGKEYRITGLIAMSDYTSLYENNTDLMFDAQHFTVAQMSDVAFDALPEYLTKYNYAWKYDDERTTKKEKSDAADALKDALIDEIKAVNTERITTYMSELFNNPNAKQPDTFTINDFVTEPDNQAIHMAGDDIGSDKSMMMVLLYIVIAILAFIFGVTTQNTIEKESAVIGTLRASGYTRRELIIHYMQLPVIVLVIAALVGNVFGYTLMKDIVVGMYYDSYSLPSYVTLWNGYAFLMTTIVPIVILTLINLVMLVRVFKLSPLRFIRHDLARKRKSRAVKLPSWKFLTRFRTRIILQNKSIYLIMFIGIAFANLILLFGLVMNPVLESYKKLVIDNMPCAYQYVLKKQTDTSVKDAEKYAYTSLDYTRDNGLDDEVSVYGLIDESKYFNIDFEGEGVYISDGIAQKYGYKVGGEITLTDESAEEEYTFIIEGIHTFPSSLAIFMPIDDYRDVFDKDDTYYSGYLSDTKITDIAEENIVLTITQDDMTVVADQLSDSMGKMFYLMDVFGILIYLIVVYLLSKVVVEKNSGAISIVKILGYQTGDVFRLYVVSTIIVVIVSIIVTEPLVNLVMSILWRAIMSSYAGWLNYEAPLYVLLEMPVIGIAAYAIVGALEYRRIAKIPMGTALKNVE